MKKGIEDMFILVTKESRSVYVCKGGKYKKYVLREGSKDVYV